MDYWFGLYKNSNATPTLPAAQLSNASYWLDGNPSTYRNWWSSEPDEATYCVRYDTNGYFRDHPCGTKYPFTCKCKPTLYCKLLSSILQSSLLIDWYVVDPLSEKNYKQCHIVNRNLQLNINPHPDLQIFDEFGFLGCECTPTCLSRSVIYI